jgi:hypothetical protein
LATYKKAIFFRQSSLQQFFNKVEISSHDLERNKGSTWKNSWSIELNVEKTVPSIKVEAMFLLKKCQAFYI